jgi:hypothetical protein
MGVFTNVQPPPAGHPFDSVAGWEWASRISEEMNNQMKRTFSLIQIVNPPPISFSDDVPLVMSNTTGAELIYRSATKSLTLANGGVDLLAINVLTKAAAFSGAVSIAGTLGVTGAAIFSNTVTVNAQLNITSGGAIITGGLGVSGGITASADIHTDGNFTAKDGQGIIFNSPTNNSFIRHVSGGLQFFTNGLHLFSLLDGGGGFELLAPVTGSASAGVSDPLPPNPAGYFQVNIIGYGNFLVPAYNL